MLKTESSTSAEMEKEVHYCQWTAGSSKEVVTSTLSEAKQEIVRQLVFVKKHNYLAKMQLQQIKTLKTTNMTEKEAVMQEDF